MGFEMKTIIKMKLFDRMLITYCPRHRVEKAEKQTQQQTETITETGIETETGTDRDNKRNRDRPRQ